MQKCPYCGADIEGLFCSRCGHGIEKPISTEKRDPEMLINRDAPKYLFIEVSSTQIGFIAPGSISDRWYIYSDGSYQIKAEADLADRSRQEITKDGRMSEDDFCELCDLIGRINWTRSSACVDSGTLWLISIYDTKGNRIHYGDSITIETLDWIVEKLRPLAWDIYPELRKAYEQSEKRASKVTTKLKNASKTEFLIVSAGVILILALVFAILFT